MLALHEGDFAAARALLAESLQIRRELGDDLSGPERASVLCGAAEALREAIGSPLPPADRARHEPLVAAARAALGEERCAAAWAEGETYRWNGRSTAR